MKKYILALAICAFSAQPLLAHADYTSYFPHCYNQRATPAELQMVINGGGADSSSTLVQQLAGEFYNGSYTNASGVTVTASTTIPADFLKANDTVAGTCHAITISNTVSVDPALENDFWLGIHRPLTIDQDGGQNDLCAQYNCLPNSGDYPPEAYTKYSEHISVGASTTATETEVQSIQSGSLSSSEVGIAPVDYILLDKKGLLPLLTSAFRKAGVTFSTDSMANNLSINIYNQSEVADVVKNYPYWSLNGYSTSTVMDIAQVADGSFYLSTENLAYGRYIYGPKGEIAESQYTPIDYGNDAILTNKDLQVSYAPYGHGYGSKISIVPETSPLRSVHNYWMFTKKNGQIVLAWEKSVYGLDDGTTRTLTRNDANTGAAMLFGGTASQTVATTASATQKKTSAATSSTPAAVAPKSQGFFARIWSWIVSWL